MSKKMHNQQSENSRNTDTSGNEGAPENSATSHGNGDSFSAGHDRSAEKDTYGKEDFANSGAEPDPVNREPERTGKPYDHRSEGNEQNQDEGESGYADAEADLEQGSSDGKSGGSDDPGREELENRIARLEEELATAKDSVLRKASEFENLKRRTQKERTNLFDDARADAVSKFLPIREDLKRSLDAASKQNVESGLQEGLRLMLANFDRVLDQYNVEPIEKTGVPFDVDMHDAMLSQPAGDDSVESNTVIQVLEPGYKIGDRVIKHAKVIVSQ